MNLRQEYIQKLSETMNLSELEEILDPRDFKECLEFYELTYIKPFVTGKYTRNEDGSYDVNGTVEYSKQTFTRFPVNFRKVYSFDCSDCVNLISLEGGPLYVKGYYDCAGCINLLNLDFSPKTQEGWFCCIGCNSLVSLKGVNFGTCKGFYCNNCKNLESIQGAPSGIDEGFDCSKCPKLKTLEGAPHSVFGDFECQDCGKSFKVEYVRSICDVRGEVKV